MNKPSNAPRKAAIYLRISLDREMDGLAIDRQREDCESLARFRRGFACRSGALPFGVETVWHGCVQCGEPDQ